MIKYKDTTHAPNAPQRAGRGQNERKKRLKDKIEVAIGMTFLFCFLLSVTTCQPVQGSSNAQTYRQALHKHDMSMGKIATSSQPKGNERLATVSQAFNQNLTTAIKNNLPLVAGMGQNKDLSKIHVSGKPYRYLLAFFVPKFWLASQASQDKDTIHLTHFTGLNRLIYSRPQLEDVTSYGGVTLQNTRKLICRAVTDVTESEPRHPMTFHSMALTQKPTSGGHYHA